MKKLFNFSILLIVFAILFMGGCKKNNDNPERKKYAWAVGARDSTSYGTILFSNDGGDTWVRQGEGSPALKNIDLSDVWAIDENTVWAVGTDNHILKTTDGGQNWTTVQAPNLPFGVGLSSISIVNKSDIWISGSPGIVYHSADDGLSWTVFDTVFFQKGLMQGIWAISSQVVYVAGGVFTDRESSGFIARTLDGGTTWETVIPPDNYDRNEWIGVKATDENNVVVYGGKAHYTHTTDGGKTWVNDSLEAGGGGGAADINCLTMLDKKTWWGALDLENIFITYDTGNTWNKQPSVGGGNMFLVGIDAYDRNLALITGTGTGYIPEGKIIKTNNGGDTWELKYLGKAGIWKVSFIKE